MKFHVCKSNCSAAIFQYILLKASGVSVQLLLILVFIISSSSHSLAQTSSFSFNQIPLSDPDINRPGAGAEQWSGQNTVNIPLANTSTTRLDAYHRFIWTDIQPFNNAANSYDWTAFDTRIQEAIRNGQKFSFDIMEICGSCGGGYAQQNIGGGTLIYPLFLHNQMQAENPKDWINGGLWIPNWNSQSWLNAWKNLNGALNNHINNTSYNGVPYKNIIRYIDVGGYGDYGEWTNNSFNGQAGTIATDASLMAIIDGTVQQYPNFQCVALIAAFDGNQLSNTMISPAVGYYALTTSNNAGKLGWRRESWGWTDNYLSQWTDKNPTVYNGMRFDTAINNRYKYAPIVGEPADLGLAGNGGSAFAALPGQMVDYHVNSFGNGNLDNNTYNSTAQDNYRAAAKAAGYRLILTDGSMTSNLTVGVPFNISVNWQNLGSSPTYESWSVVYEFRTAGGAVAASVTSAFNPNQFLPSGSPQLVSDMFSLPASVQAGTYNLYMIIRDPLGYRNPMPLAITGVNGDGSYLLRSNISVIAGSGNKPPTANAGADKTIQLPINTVLLSGTGADIDGTIASYAWTKLSGPTGDFISAPGAQNTDITGLVQGVYGYVLTVMDNQGAIGTDTVQVTVIGVVANQLPIADPGANQSITLPVSTVNLDGSASYDPDGTITKYNWVTVSGPGSATINNSNTAKPSVTGLQLGIYIFELTVTDNLGAISKNQVSVIVNPKPILPNQAPVANAGTNQSITLPVNSIILNGTSSFDADGTISAYSWKQISGPSTSVITAGNTSTPTASQLIVGQYVFELTVTDNNGAKNADQITISVNPAQNKSNVPPVANAGSNDLLSLPNNSYTLNATKSTDPDGSIVAYSWNQISGPNTVNSPSLDGPMVTISDLQVGDYTFQVTVTDNTGATSTATMKLKVVEPSLSDQLTIYPNPAHNVINEKITSSITGKVKINIYDMNGRMVLSTQVEKTDNMIIKTTAVDMLAPGMYTIQINISNRKTMVAKFVKN